MGKHQVAQKYIFKLDTARLKRANWDLALTLDEARQNGEVISIGDSQMLRWIDELNGLSDTEEQVRQLWRDIRAMRRQPDSPQARKEMRRLYSCLDKLQFKSDYIHLVMDKPKDLWRASAGFKINGVTYTRLLGTSGGVKNSTVVFVNAALAPELRRRIDNGRDLEMPFVPAKLEAYRALTCSGTSPVSMPHGILVVDDCVTKFREDVISLDDKDSDEPKMEFVKGFEFELDESDGYGLMLPSLAKRWSEEMKMGYDAGAMVMRFAWAKGALFAFDFLEFAEKVAGSYVVKDVWGNDVDIRNVELILTTSMLKLWDSYNSLDHYLSCCEQNHYTFGITKVAPEKLESKRATNYQYVQAQLLNDDQIQRLIQPTIDEIKDVVTGDYRKALIFLLGDSYKEDGRTPTGVDPIVTCLMTEPKMFEDPHMKRVLFHMIERRIRRAKIGVLNVHGNYSIISGDPYALCQSIFGLEVTGLLKAGEIFNKYWMDYGADVLAAFRAPMSALNNIRRVKVARGEEVEHWFQYMKSSTAVSAWSSETAAWNGADKDGDIIMLTDNAVILEALQDTPTIVCAQRKGQKKVPTDDDMIQSNIAGFGDDIGKTTNYITSMYDVRAKYEEGSREYDELSYRIISGQLYQQNAIDKIKGIQCKSMPKWWHDFHACALPDNPTEQDVERRNFNLSILADKKPYFMRYIYSPLMRDYNKYMKSAEANCRTEFHLNLADLLAIPKDQLTDDQREFISAYYYYLPVSTNDGVMNKICRIFEKEFDGYLKLNYTGEEFDVQILKNDSTYTSSQYYRIRDLFKQFKELASRASEVRHEISESDEDDAESRFNIIARECHRQCTNSDELANIVVDLCYKTEGSRRFVWAVSGNDIAETMLKRHDYMLTYPVVSDDGDILYGQKRYKMVTKRKWENDRAGDGREGVLREHPADEGPREETGDDDCATDEVF